MKLPKDAFLRDFIPLDTCNHIEKWSETGELERQLPLPPHAGTFQPSPTTSQLSFHKRFLSVKIIYFFHDFMQTLNQTALLKLEGKSNSSKKNYTTRFILLHGLILRSVIIFPVYVCN